MAPSPLTDAAPARPRESVPGERERSWADWYGSTDPYTIGLEDEVMLVDAATHALALRADTVLADLPEDLRPHVSPETHACVVEIKTGVHPDVGGAVGQLHAIRERLTEQLSPLGLRPASAGTHAVAPSMETTTTDDDRYREVARTMGYLARREPTMALHMHIGIPHPEDAIRVLNHLRENLPILIALAANSPLAHGHDTGFCSTRTVIFGGFPRTGAPRRFRSYFEYVQAIDALIAPGAIPNPTFLWWDVRLQPALGTVEVRAMDAQTTVEDVATLAALVQCLARQELEGDTFGRRTSPEVLEENRFLAARDGVRAELIDAGGNRLSPLRNQVEPLIAECRPHAAALRCSAALEHVEELLDGGGAARQRAQAGREGIESVVPSLADLFVDPVRASY